MPIFTMTSKTWAKKFLNNESVKDILFSQYVLVSSRIRLAREDLYININNASILQPPPEIVVLSRDQYKQRYPIYLRGDHQKVVLAQIVRCATEGCNVIIMTTPNEEDACPVLKSIAKEIENLCGYPVYDYEDFYDGKVTVTIDAERDARISKKCAKIEGDTRTDNFLEQLSTENGRRQFDRALSRGDISKNAMIELLKKEGLYEKGMSKSDMKEAIRTFM